MVRCSMYPLSTTICYRQGVYRFLGQKDNFNTYLKYKILIGHTKIALDLIFGKIKLNIYTSFTHSMSTFKGKSLGWVVNSTVIAALPISTDPL